METTKKGLFDIKNKTEEKHKDMKKLSQWQVDLKRFFHLFRLLFFFFFVLIIIISLPYISSLLPL